MVFASGTLPGQVVVEAIRQRWDSAGPLEEPRRLDLPLHSGRPRR